jgi:hypothetical protein
MGNVRHMGTHRRERRRAGPRVGVVGAALVLLAGAVLWATADGGDHAAVVSAAGEPALLPAAPPAGEEPESEGLPAAPQVNKVGQKQPGKPVPLIPGIGGGSPLSTPLLSHPTGHYVVAPGTDTPPGAGREVRYLVEVEDGLPFTPAQFATDVARILNAPQGWGRGGAGLRFVRVDAGPVAFRVSLSSPRLTDAQCAPLRTYGRVSCFNGSRAVINEARWRYGSPTYGRDINAYRDYVISHEVGHALGRHHVHCTAAGKSAPVMVQQTKSLEGCRANPWPYSD